MPMKEIEISIFSEKIIINDDGINEEHKRKDDPFYYHKIVRSIDDVKLRKKGCKIQTEMAIQFSLMTAEQNLDTFQIAQTIREYGWLFFYLLKLHARILVLVNSFPEPLLVLLPFINN
jgi:hypothetical protein